MTQLHLTVLEEQKPDRKGQFYREFWHSGVYYYSSTLNYWICQ